MANDVFDDDLPTFVFAPSAIWFASAVVGGARDVRDNFAPVASAVVNFVADGVGDGEPVFVSSLSIFMVQKLRQTGEIRSRESIGGHEKRE